jgi:hypothetical protein
VEVGGQSRVGALVAARPPSLAPGEEHDLAERLSCVSIDPDTAMVEWLRTVTGRAAARFLSSSTSFRYFAAAAPGAKELVTMVKLLDLLGRHELIVLDAPATGHALAMLRSPQTFSAIARFGPLASRSREVSALLGDPERSAYVAVAQGGEMAVAETLELEQSLRTLLDRDLDAVIVNGVLPRRFSREEMARLAELQSRGTPDGEQAIEERSSPDGERAIEERGAIDREGGPDQTTGAAVRAAYATYGRALTQQSQIARLRRQRFGGGRPARVLSIPFEFTSELNRTSVARIAARLGRNL